MLGLFKQARFALPAAAFVLAAVAAPSLLSIGGDEAEAGTTTTVFVNNSKFCGSAGSSCVQPFSIQIDPGNTVEWLDGQAGFSHTVTQCSADGNGCPGGSPGFDSGPLTDPPMNLYLSQTFPSAGTFFYRCQVHGNSMRGIITVGSPTTPTPTPVPTPTPTPFSVGGISDFPDIDGSPAAVSGSSEGSSFALAALVSGLLVAFAMFVAGAWYARRRWLR